MTTKKEQFIQILRLDAQGFPSVEVIENKLECFQEIVGGLIEIVYFDEVLCIINEEGKLNGLKPNFVFPIGEGHFDIIVGDVFFVGDTGDEFKSITDVEIRHALNVASEGRETLVDMYYQHLLGEN